MTSDARPKLNFAGPFCIIQDSPDKVVIEMTKEGLEQLIQLLDKSPCDIFVSTNLLYHTLITLDQTT